MSTATTPASTSRTLATSQEIRDRGSTFAGTIYRVDTVDEAKALVRQCATPPQRRTSPSTPPRPQPRPHGGTSEDTGTSTGTQGRPSGPDRDPPYTIAAWRCMVVKSGCTGLGGPDEFEVGQGWEDGGERGAGRRVLGVMQREGVIDAVVVVRRWFGGTLLGPVRFAHVETCADEVCRRFRKVEEMAECVQTLNTLDALLATLRTQLAVLREGTRSGEVTASTVPKDSGHNHKAPDYRVIEEALDLTKAKRLIHTRECAIDNTKKLIDKYTTSA